MPLIQSASLKRHLKFADWAGAFAPYVASTKELPYSDGDAKDAHTGDVVSSLISASLSYSVLNARYGNILGLLAAPLVKGSVCSALRSFVLGSGLCKES